jgi:hypothetical protein
MPNHDDPAPLADGEARVASLWHVSCYFHIEISGEFFVEEDDFHAKVVAAVARNAHQNGDVEKATELFRSIVKHHWLSPECTIALNYLVRGRHLPALRANSGFENRT